MGARPLVECVPNFSEGRRTEVIDAIVESMKRSGAVHILDISSDADHNRTVVTMVGLPEEIERVIFLGIRTAAEFINLDNHVGEHPRFGATDVVPFIPIRDVTMDDCVKMAKRVAKRVGEELKIPVYLYESAATRPDRENLANIRKVKFQYEQLKEVIGTDPRYVPDFGPAAIGKAGATIIGARPPLIAYNVYLTTSDVEIAKKIAVSVRESGGGLAFVKAAGFLVEGKAQVSMNLTHYEKTPIFRAVEMIRREAQRYGVGILSSELVGLAPEMALIESARWYLQLDGFKPEQLLETRIALAEQEPVPFAYEEPPVPEDSTSNYAILKLPESRRPTEFVEAVAASNATPGGGAVAALAGALAASLAEMVAGLTIGKKKYADVEKEMQAIVKAAQDLRERLLDDVVNDVGAFDALMNAYRVPKDDPERPRLIQEGTRGAIDVPLRVCRMALEALQLTERVASIGNTNAATDGAVGAYMALAAMEGAALNVRVNLLGLEDAEFAEHLRSELDQLLEQARAVHQQTIQAATTRVGLT
jgi:glutamate formiminotransferase/formiminotetrahydrofolate cyclodeaminase